MGPLDALLAVLQGLPMSILLTVASFALGFVLAIPLALLLRSRFAIVRLIFRFIVDLLRGVPIIVWLFVLKFGVHFGTFHFTPMLAAIVGLGVVSAAYLAEIMRGGIGVIARGQNEAAHALGLSRTTTFTRIIAPQAFRVVMPSIATYLIGLFKDTSIASTIIVAEMVFQAQSYAQQHLSLDGVLPYIYAGIFYIVLSIPLAMWSRRLDRRLQEAN